MKRGIHFFAVFTRGQELHGEGTNEPAENEKKFRSERKEKKIK